MLQVVDTLTVLDSQLQYFMAFGWNGSAVVMVVLVALWFKVVAYKGVVVNRT